jgi:hypothetical protein
VLHGAVHDAVVRQAERRHVELRGAGGEAIDLAGAVEQRVLAVNVQVDGGRRHGLIMPIDPDATGPRSCK